MSPSLGLEHESPGRHRGQQPVTRLLLTLGTFTLLGLIIGATGAAFFGWLHLADRHPFETAPWITTIGALALLAILGLYVARWAVDVSTVAQGVPAALCGAPGASERPCVPSPADTRRSMLVQLDALAAAAASTTDPDDRTQFLQRLRLQTQALLKETP